MMKFIEKMTLTAKIRTGFFAMVVLIALISGLSFMGMQHIHEGMLELKSTIEELQTQSVYGNQATLANRLLEEEKALDALLLDVRDKTMIANAVVVLIAVVLSGLVAKLILQPVIAITASVRKVADGDMQEEIPYADLKDQIGDIARALTELREDHVHASRALGGMTNASSNIMMADPDLNITFMNKSQEKMLRNAESDLKQVLPNFNVGNLIGQNIDQFHANPSHQRQLLGALQTSYSTRISVAGRTFDLFANPSFSKSGQRLGTTIEWVDRTAELAIADEIKTMIDAASSGDLDNRIILDGKEGFFLEVSEGINNLAAVMQDVANDLAVNLNALAAGNLTSRIDADYNGIFKQLKDDYNATAEKLSSIVGRIKNISIDVSSNSNEMAESSNGLANRAEQQASTLEETAASMEELTSTVKANADNAKEVNDSAISTRKIAERGSQVANDAGHAMEKINESSKQITDIINVIDEIAFQTNLLALNAAVEAARAGDAGRGFAVVAQEVRTLAQRSAQSSKDIKELIDGSSKQVSEGVDLVQTAVGSLQQIYDAIDGVADTIGQIANASSEQATSLDELNQAVMEMDSMTQQNAAMAQQSRNGSQLMLEKSMELSEMVSFFKLDDSDVQITPVGSKSSLDKPRLSVVAETSRLEKKVAASGGASGAKVTANDADNDADWKEF